ncbi:protein DETOXIFICATION 42 [Cannabis sativa]|uniref:protein DETOXIFICATION 42 n=1 Tax=Cannabis sativa TaxID=3483 RepID=UPI0029C9B451|nr:protein DETOXIFICATION 42 [Cannabis sativa]
MGRFPLFALFKEAKNVFTKDELNLEIAHIALPSALALTADPIASLIDTAFIGHIGPVELAAVGISIAIFNQASKIAIFPLVSITTSFVAEEEAAAEKSFDDIEMQRNEELKKEMEELVSLVDSASTSSSTTSDESDIMMLEHVRRHIPSASSAMVIGSILGLIQALFLILAAKRILIYMGVDSNSPMQKPAIQYLSLRSLGAPAVLLSLAIQGVFRGLKDTKTPLYATMIGDATNIILDPIFIFLLKWGISGAAIAHVISQYLISLILLWRLMKIVNLVPPRIEDIQFSRFLKNGSFLLVRVIAATLCVTLAASLAARHGSTTMAAFQVCLQVWMATSLVADGLAVAGQAILASAFAMEDYSRVTATVSRVLQLGLVLGLFLSLIITIILKFCSKLFTKEPQVLELMSLGIPFVAVTQPINALAFVFDGINYGASDFAYSAYSMVLVGIISIWCLFVLSSTYGFVGIWIALSLYMTLRTCVGFWRVGTGTGPWRFLRD